jgi:hypothetical protein
MDSSEKMVNLISADKRSAIPFALKLFHSLTEVCVGLEGVPPPLPLAKETHTPYLFLVVTHKS